MQLIKNIIPLIILFIPLGVNSQETAEIKNYLYQDPNSLDRSTLNDLLVQYTDSGNLDAVKHLLEYGADPNATFEGGDITALMYASQNGNFNIAKLLIEKGADVNLVPWDGNSALFAAIRSNDDSISELLLANGAIVNLANSDGLTPIHYSAGYGYPYLTELLVYYGSTIDTSDYLGNTPLISATYSGAKQCASMLLNYGANPNLCDNFGHTPLMIASQFNDTALIKLLLEFDAQINTKNKRNVDAIAFAIQCGSKDALKLLLQSTDTIKTNIKENINYYQLAKESANLEIIDILKQFGYKKNIKPSINSINFYCGFDLSYGDFMYDFGGGIYEPVSKLLIDLGFKYRPFSSRVYEYRDSTIYQFWEKRNSLYISCNYLHQLFNSRNFKLGLLAGLNGEYSWSNFRGTNIDRNNIFLLVPSAGIYLKKEYFILTAKWMLANYKTPNLDKNRFGVQLFITIPTNKNRVINKQINWLD